MPQDNLEEMLTGGHPNSLGRTVEVVDIVFANPPRLDELYNCYFSDDEVVRLRTSSAMKRVCQAQPGWLVPYLDRFIDVIAKIDQASTQWTLAILFQMLAEEMSPAQLRAAKKILRNNLATNGDWIVLNYTMQTLAEWSADDPVLKRWLMPKLTALSSDRRKSVSGRAKKLVIALS